MVRHRVKVRVMRSGHCTIMSKFGVFNGEWHLGEYHSHDPGSGYGQGQGYG